MTTTCQTADPILNKEAMVSCSACGKEIHPSASACPGCGVSRRTSRYKSKTVAALFAFFLGSFGAHRFYLGQWWGIFYLLLFWSGIPGIISFIEFIYFLLRDSKKWDDKYNDGIPAGESDGSRGGVVVLLVIVGAFFFIAILGILAAIALPAYQDYTVKTKVNATWIEMQPIKNRIESHFITQGKYPISNAELGLKEPYIVGQSNVLTITPEGVRIDFNENSHALKGKTFIITPLETESAFTWQCNGGTLGDHYRPSSCSH